MVLEVVPFNRVSVSMSPKGVSVAWGFWGGGVTRSCDKNSRRSDNTDPAVDRRPRLRRWLGHSRFPLDAMGSFGHEMTEGRGKVPGEKKRKKERKKEVGR